MKIACLIACLVVLISLVPASAIDLNPEAPPGLGDKITMFLGWLYWLALLGAVAGLIFSLVSMIFLNRDSRMWVIVCLIVLAALVALPEILNAIGV